MASVRTTIRGSRHLVYGCLFVSLAGLIMAVALSACGSSMSATPDSPVDVVFNTPKDEIVGGVRLSDPSRSWDGFGGAVDVHGAVLVIGASDWNHYGPGLVHVYRSSGNAWPEETQLTASDRDILAKQAQPNEGPRFGSSVAVDEGIIAVGAPGTGDTRAGGYAGAVYVFDYDGQNWVETAKLTPDSADRSASAKVPAWLQATGLSHRAFGALVALDGDTLAVSGDSVAGSVYVFRRSAGGWQKQTRLQISPRSEKDLYLTSLALYGDTLTLSALYVLPPTGRPVGVLTGTPVVYVFERAGDAWKEIVHFAPDGDAGIDLFGIDENIGASVALAGSAGRASRLAVGLPGYPDWSKVTNVMRVWGAGSEAKFPESKRQAGAVYLFERDEKGRWGQPATLKPAGWDNPPGPPSRYASVLETAAAATTAPTPAPPTAGSPAAPSSATPAANSFDFMSVFPGDVLSENPAITFFGSTVDLDENRLAVTSGYANATYVFEGGGRNWTYRFSLAPGRTSGDVWEDYAQVVRLSGDTLLLGTPGEFGNSVYVFNLTVSPSLK
jgi:hypothetical protein